MKSEVVDKYFGITTSEWIERIPNELKVDAVGLWHIIPVGRENFGLEGDALKEFVRLSVIALIRRGACPVLPSSGKDKDWIIQPQYGDSPEEIASNVLMEWQNAELDPNEDGLWFALPDL